MRLTSPPSWYNSTYSRTSFSSCSRKPKMGKIAVVCLSILILIPSLQEYKQHWSHSGLRDAYFALSATLGSFTHLSCCPDLDHTVYACHILVQPSLTPRARIHGRVQLFTITPILHPRGPPHPRPLLHRRSILRAIGTSTTICNSRCATCSMA